MFLDHGVSCDQDKRQSLGKTDWRAQTLPDEAAPIGKIHPFSKMAVTFEPLIGF